MPVRPSIGKPGPGELLSHAQAVCLLTRCLTASTPEPHPLCMAGEAALVVAACILTFTLAKATL